MVETLKKNLITIAIIIAGIFIAGAVFYINQGKLKKNLLTPQQAAAKTIDFINQNMLQGEAKASLMDATEENGVYKVHFKVAEQEYDFFVTQDGKFLFTGGIDLDKKPETQEQSESKKMTCEGIPKVEKPLFEAFVVSQCPYGLQMQRVLDEIVKNIPSLADDIKVEYIGAIENGKITSMHGDVEAQENLRQICLREEQPEKYWSYISCHIKKGDTENCLTQVGVDKEKLNNCINDSSKGLKYAKEDFDSQNKYKVTGSPTLFLNGEKVNEFDFGGRTAQAVKTLLCCGFQTVPDTCSQKLTEEQAATGFSETYTQSSGSSDGSCQ